MDSNIIEIYSSKEIALEKLNDIYNKDSIIIVLKSDQYLENVISIGFCINKEFFHFPVDDNKEFWLQKIIDIIEQKELKVYSYDIKYLFSVFLKNNINIERIDLFKDVSFYLYDMFGNNTPLFYENIFNITDVEPIETSYMKHYDSQFKFDNFPNQVLTEKELDEQVRTELKIIFRLINSFKFRKADYIDLYNLASYYYAHIENTGFKIDHKAIDKHGYSNISKYFSDYNEGEHFAKAKWNFDRTSTGRLSSKFHNFPKKYSDIIVPRHTDGVLMGLDFTAFEFKTLLAYLEVKFEEDDPYEYIASQTRYNRSAIKNTMIKYIYGSSEIDYFVLKKLKEVFDIDKKLNLLIINARKTKSITTPHGRIIKYKEESEVNRKAVNNIIQNMATYYITYVTSIITNILKKEENGLQGSNVIATVYDEIILDIHPEHIDFIKANIIKWIDSIDKIKNPYVKFIPKITIGKNLAELKK